jgi:hypothetical protein
MAYAKGSKAFGFCDLTGFRYPLNELVWEVRLGKRTGFRVGKDVVDPDQPQLYLGRVKIFDPQSLYQPRVDTAQAEANAIWGWNPVWNPLQYAVGSVGTVTVTTT